IIVLLLLATNVRLIVENFLKYGVLIRLPTQRSISDLDWLLTFVLGVYILASSYVCFYIERLMISEKGDILDDKKKRFYRYLHTLNISLVLIMTTYTVYFWLFHPFLGFIMMLFSSITALKLISFACVNSSLRSAYEKKEKIHSYEIEYPNNLTSNNFIYFLLAPTLCYQPSYPRTEKIRVGFLLKRIAEFTLSTLLMYFLVVQYAIPTLRNSITRENQVHNPNPVFVFERVLKLSSISVIVWLLGFYAFFHSFLNALAEVLKFGDRNFYLPWWNSSSLSQYWRLWNQPVHNWMKRHVYVPVVNAGYSQLVAVAVSFFFSAVFHELLFGVSVHSIQGFAFWGMLGQIPLIIITDLIVKYRGPTTSAGNVVFWLAFCIIGQPLLVVLYYYDWTKRNPPLSI
ncbi:hypothetical protein K502DRAFT_294346, partial [Neoconidiobolus thromboides FSU 785]